MAKICIVGAGSIGCYLGGRLLAAGADVTLVGRARIGDELRTHGLTLTDYRGGRWQVDAANVAYMTEPDVAATADLVLVTVKSAATASVADALKPLLRPGTVVVSFQNGLGNADVLRAALPQQTVLAGMVPFNVMQPGPGAQRANWRSRRRPRCTSSLILSGVPVCRWLSVRTWHRCNGPSCCST